MNSNNWYWACPRNEPAGDRFVIERGQEALWPRVKSEIDASEHCAWMRINDLKKPARIEDILDLMLTVVPHYRVNQNKFVFEAAKIPVFAKFLRGARADLCNYVSNSCFPDHASAPEPYSDENMRRLGRIVSATLNCDDDWF